VSRRAAPGADATLGGVSDGTVVVELTDAPWLPAGGRALVVEGGSPHAPMCLVRLLARRGDRVFCVPREGAGKLDLPTRRVEADDPDGARAVAALATAVTGGPGNVCFLGAVTNVVSEAGDDYPWPTPSANFGVWVTDAMPVVEGSWISLAGQDVPLRDRHWFPLLARSGSGGTARTALA